VLMRKVLNLPFYAACKPCASGGGAFHFPCFALLSQRRLYVNALHAAWHPAAPSSSSSAGHGATCGPLTLEFVT
jgi:hypothetical protein